MARRAGSRASLLEVFMVARPVRRPMIRLNGTPGHGVPAYRADRGGCRSCQRRVPDRLRAAGRLASRPPGQVRGARLAHGLPAAGRCPDFGDRTDVAGSREAAGALHPADRADARPARGARAVAPPGDATGDEAMGVYSDLRGLALAHRSCGELRGDADPLTPDGYRPWVA